MKQRPTTEILAAIDGDSVTPKERKGVPDRSFWIPFYPDHSVESFSGLYLRQAERKALAA
jgi:hypothetical protein